jgi:hypothetical protein
MNKLKTFLRDLSPKWWSVIFWTVVIALLLTDFL